MNYTNFKSIIDDLKKIEFYHKQTNSFGVGDIKQLTYLIQQRDKQENTQDRPPIYPLMYVIPRQVQNYENYVQYSLNVLVCDIMNANNYDIEVDLWSSTLAIAQDILAQYKYSVNAQQGDYENKYDLILPSVLTPFSEAYDDLLVGWNLDLNIIVDMPLNRCLAPFDNWATPNPTCTPTESPIPPTPTNTETPTQTPTMTMTPTPSATCPITTQYYQVEMTGSTEVVVSLWTDPDFTIPTNALCEYTISGYTQSPNEGIQELYWEENIVVGEHQIIIDLEGLIASGITYTQIYDYTTSGCSCPIALEPGSCAICDEVLPSINLCFTGGTGDVAYWNGNYNILPAITEGVSCAYSNSWEDPDPLISFEFISGNTFEVNISGFGLFSNYYIEISDGNCNETQFNIVPYFTNADYDETSSPNLNFNCSI